MSPGTPFFDNERDTAPNDSTQTASGGGSPPTQTGSTKTQGGRTTVVRGAASGANAEAVKKLPTNKQEDPRYNKTVNDKETRNISEDVRANKTVNDAGVR